VRRPVFFMLCPECYHEVPGESGVCPFCETPVRGAAEGAAEAVEGPSVPAASVRDAGSCPWEDRQRLGTFSALAETIQGSLFRPTEFFRQMPPEGSKWRALLFAVIVGTMAWIVAMLWESAFGLPDLLENVSQLPAMTGVFLYFTLVFIPVLVVLSTIFQSAVIHVSLTFLNGARENYEATLKAVSYAASASLLMVFPFVGWPLGMVWRVVLLVIGLREVHRISTGRAFFALLLPAVIVVTLFFLAFAFASLVLLRLWPELGDVIAV
jgi:hypothetical protein